MFAGRRPSKPLARPLHHKGFPVKCTPLEKKCCVVSCGRVGFAVNQHQPMKTTNTADLPSNEFASVTAGSIIKCEQSNKQAQQNMLAGAKRFAIEHFSRPHSFYHDIGMLFVAQNDGKFGWIGAHEVADEPNVCFVQVCRVMFPI
jgi:hypothetical protein